jgi:hypothetical protein
VTTTAPWLHRNPVFGYLALAYGLSWGGILIVLGASGFDLKDLQPLDTALIFVAMLLGPSVGGLVMSGRLEGRAGLRELASSLCRWRVGGVWYAVALLTMPMVLLAVLWPLGDMLDPAYAPRFQWPLFAVGLVAGSFEELGWIWQTIFAAALWLVVAVVMTRFAQGERGTSSLPRTAEIHGPA